MNIPKEHRLVKAKPFKFCPWCGASLIERKIDDRTRLVCPECDFIWYKNPIPAVGAIIMEDNRLLLVKRKYPPQVGYWCFPAGFMEFDESPMECCRREIKEETGLDIKVDRLFWNYQAGDDPRSKVVLIIYLATVIGGALAPGDDAVEVRYFKLDEIPSNIAFDAHRRAIGDYRRYLQDGQFPGGNE